MLSGRQQADHQWCFKGELKKSPHPKTCILSTLTYLYGVSPLPPASIQRNDFFLASRSLSWVFFILICPKEANDNNVLKKKLGETDGRRNHVWIGGFYFIIQATFRVFRKYFLRYNTMAMLARSQSKPITSSTTWWRVEVTVNTRIEVGSHL